MSVFSKASARINELKEDRQFENNRRKVARQTKSALLWIFKIIMFIGISYVIIGPLIGIISKSFFSDADQYNNMVFVIPMQPTLERYETALSVLKYPSVMLTTLIYTVGIMLLNVIVCSMVGYGFARFEFPGKGILFGLVIVMIVIPTHSIMLPLYTSFREVDFFGIIKSVRGESLNLMGTMVPSFLLSLFAAGLRSGLYIYIFNQFFRGLPKEIEEAAFVDGAGMFYTYFRIMLVNAMPSVVTVAIFSLVWQYNDTFYSSLFQLSDHLISLKVSSLAATVGNTMSLNDPNIIALYNDAGIVLVILPVLIMYMILQKQFIEGVERSGIVG